MDNFSLTRKACQVSRKFSRVDGQQGKCGPGRRPSQGFASVFSYYLWCSEFPERLQSLNSDIEPGY